MRCTLEKLSMDEGQHSRVQPGYRQSGAPHIYLAGEHDPEPLKEINGIKVGWQVAVVTNTGWLNTSPVKEVLEVGDDFVKFKTRTSIYLLRKADDALQET